MGGVTSYAMHTPFDPPLVGIAGGDNNNNNDWSKVWTNGASLPTGTRLDFDVLVEGAGKMELSFSCAGSGQGHVAFAGLKQPKWLSPPTFVVSGNQCPPTTS